MWLLGRVDTGLRTATEGPLLDRAIGFATIVALASLGAPSFLRALPEVFRHSALNVVVVLLMLLCLTACLIHWDSRRTKKFAACWRFLAPTFANFRNWSPKYLAVVVLLALVTHSLNVVAIRLLLDAAGVNLDLATCFLIVPTALLLSMFPASISGWGIREGALVVELSGFKVLPEQVIVASVLFGLCVLTASLPGAVVWLSIRSSSRRLPSSNLRSAPQRE